MIYGYIRVSSDKQTVENQRFEINNFCQREQLHINGWIEETISGTKNTTQALYHMLSNVPNKIYAITDKINNNPSTPPMMAIALSG